MAIDETTVKRVANLARIKMDDSNLGHITQELSAVLDMIGQLQEVNIDDVKPMTSVLPMNAPLREDIINDGEKAGQVLANAPLTREGFFAVPKVIE